MPVILCNAESYGFGPSGILFTIYPWLRRLSFSSAEPLELHYIGSGLSLDIHKAVPWDQIHHCDVNSNDGAETLARICEELKPVIFVTVTDGTAATIARERGTCVVIIDALLWYWQDLPAPWTNADRVIALDFFGVAERIERDHLTNVVRVPPLLPSTSPSGQSLIEASTSEILINLGGLENPHTDILVNIAYARLVIGAVDAARESLILDGKQTPDKSSLVILASKAVCQGLKDTRAMTATPELSRLYLRHSKCAFLTPGYNNIFDAAELACVASFLPPSNLTQGLQLNIIRDAGLAPYALDWHEILLDIPPIDYWSPETEGLLKVAEAHQSATISEKAQSCLRNYCRSALQEALNESNGVKAEMQSTKTQPLCAILERFGRDDGHLIVEAISELVPSIDSS